MKKLLVTTTILIVFLANSFAISDYDNGYLQGYADALAGKPNVVQNATEENTGVWIQKHYVDENGNAKTSGYLGTGWQKGSYSTTTISNGNLLWYFIIDRQGVAFKLFEDGNVTPLKGTGSEEDNYILSITTPDGEVTTYNGLNYSDRIWFIEDKKEIETLLNAGQIKLNIERNGQPTKYNLGIFDGTGFEAAFIQMYGRNF